MLSIESSLFILTFYDIERLLLAVACMNIDLCCAVRHVRSYTQCVAFDHFRCIDTQCVGEGCRSAKARDLGPSAGTTRASTSDAAWRHSDSRYFVAAGVGVVATRSPACAAQNAGEKGCARTVRTGRSCRVGRCPELGPLHFPRVCLQADSAHGSATEAKMYAAGPYRRLRPSFRALERRAKSSFRAYVAVRIVLVLNSSFLRLVRALSGAVELFISETRAPVRCLSLGGKFTREGLSRISKFGFWALDRDPDVDIKLFKI